MISNTQGKTYLIKWQEIVDAASCTLDALKVELYG